MPRYTGELVWSSFVPFQVTFSLRSAWRFFRWNAVSWVLVGFGGRPPRWFSLYYAPSSFSPLPRVVSTCSNVFCCVVRHRSSAYMKLLVASGRGWSLVYTLNNRGGSTEPCGRPFRWFRHLLCLPFSSILNRRFDSIVLMNFASGASSVSITSLARSRRHANIILKRDHKVEMGVR